MFAGGVGHWFLIAPGLTLILFGMAILIWPELLAYMVAGLFIAVGFSLSGWGWRMTKGQRRATNQWQFMDE